jgi:ribosomal protein L11 methyltransferase
MAEEQLPGLLLTVRVSLPLTLTGETVAQMASLLEAEAISTSWEKTAKDWDVLWLVDFHANATQLAKKFNAIEDIGLKASDIKIDPVDDINWLEHSYQSFPPFKIKDFFIHGSHFDGTPPKGTIPLQIDAATAFGSGEHGTTRGCMEALHLLHKDGFKPRTILDMGTGSGILAIAAYKLWKKPTLAIDNDREATRVACRHRKMNDVPSGDKGLTCATGNGYKARRVQQAPAFDLIIANILAQPLVEMAPDMEKCLSKKGKLILSGLLTTQEDMVMKAHKELGLKKIKAIRHDEWSALILERAA